MKEKNVKENIINHGGGWGVVREQRNKKWKNYMRRDE